MATCVRPVSSSRLSGGIGSGKSATLEAIGILRPSWSLFPEPVESWVAYSPAEGLNYSLLQDWYEAPSDRTFRLLQVGRVSESRSRRKTNCLPRPAPSHPDSLGEVHQGRVQPGSGESLREVSESRQRRLPGGVPSPVFAPGVLHPPRPLHLGSGFFRKRNSGGLPDLRQLHDDRASLEQGETLGESHEVSNESEGRGCFRLPNLFKRSQPHRGQEEDGRLVRVGRPETAGHDQPDGARGGRGSNSLVFGTVRFK